MATLKLYDQERDDFGSPLEPIQSNVVGIRERGENPSLFEIGDRVRFENPEGAMIEGTVTDVFRGPVTGWWVYDVDGDGFYEEELSRAVPEPEQAA